MPEIEELWKIARATLWTTINLEGRKITRHMISHDKVTRSLENGGLALIHPRQAAVTSLISTMSGIYRHSWENEMSTLNILENLLRAGWEDRLFVLNGRNVLKIFTNLRNIFP